MSLQDPVSDMLTRIRNAQRATKVTVKMPSSTQKVNIAKVLKDEGYITDYSVSGDAKKDSNLIGQFGVGFYSNTESDKP